MTVRLGERAMMATTSLAGPGAGRQSIMLGSLAVAAFLASSSAVSRAPFLLDMARDLDTDLTAVANLMSITSTSWGITSLVAGTASDRLGRKTILATAFVLLSVSIVGLALAPSFLLAAAW